MNIAEFKNIEKDLAPNTPLKLPFKVVRLCINNEKIKNSFKNHAKINLKYFWNFLLFFVIIFLIVFVIVDGGFIFLISSIYFFSALICLYWLYDLCSIGQIDEELKDVYNRWIDEYSVLTFTNTELIFKNPLDEIVKIIKIDDILGFYCYSSLGKNSQWIYVEYGDVGNKKSYEYIQPFSDCFCTYVELAGDKYLIDSPNHRTNTSIINIFHQIINALRENPNLTEISFNKSYYINWR